MSSSPYDDLVLHLNRHDLAELSIHSLVRQTSNFNAMPITVCGWIRVSDPYSTQVVVNQGHYSSEEAGWSIFLEEGCLTASVHGHGKTTVREIPLTDSNQWHHFAVIIDTAKLTITLFLNGNQNGQRSSKRRLQLNGPAPRQDGLLIGGYTDRAGGHFNYTFGRRKMDMLDDLRIYNRALSIREIVELTNPSTIPPVASFTMKAANNNAPVSVKFNAKSSYDSDGLLTAYWWDFGDGKEGEGPMIEHTYRYAGSYLVRLTVLDDNHAQSILEQTLELEGAAPPVKFSPVFVNGEGGYAGFRIPSIVTAENGDLVAFAEGRLESISDSTRTIRIVCKRSMDNGQTWGPLQVVGRNCVDGEEYAAMYPAPVVDRVLGTGRIILVYKKMACSEWDLAQGKGTSQVACVFSDDHGITWQGERDITYQVHRPDKWPIQIPTAGHAIQLSGHGGRIDLFGWLLFVGGHSLGNDSVFDQRNYAFWSKNLGISWHMGPDIEDRADGTSAKGLNEAIAVELSDGRIMINSRNYRNQHPVGCRAVTIGEFDESGILQFGIARDDCKLVEPPVQASLLRYLPPNFQHEKGIILFSNPAHPSARRNLTVRASFDDGESWPFEKVIDDGPSAYSDLVKQENGQIGVLYERGNDGGIFYGSFSLDWLLDGQKTVQ